MVDPPPRFVDDKTGGTIEYPNSSANVWPRRSWVNKSGWLVPTLEKPPAARQRSELRDWSLPACSRPDGPAPKELKCTTLRTNSAVSGSAWQFKHRETSEDIYEDYITTLSAGVDWQCRLPRSHVGTSSPEKKITFIPLSILDCARLSARASDAVACCKRLMDGLSPSGTKSCAWHPRAENIKKINPKPLTCRVPHAWHVLP